MTGTNASVAPGPGVKLPSDGDISGRWMGEEEIALLREVILSGTLNSTKGRMVKRFEEAFAQAYGRATCVATASGSAAVHTALAALNLPPGSEVVTTPITDMGGLTPILYERLRPVFADVDPDSGNVTAGTLAAAISPRTRAAVIVHLFGQPCEMGPIVELCRDRGVALVEDCAQAYFAEWGGQRVGTFGPLAAFSMQQGKHMTCGEGGMVLTDDAALARRARVFVNKAWPYGEPNPDHEFRALNYRLTELQGAVALGQLGKVHRVVERRVAAAVRLTELLADLPGLVLPRPAARGVHVYWRYCLMVEPEAWGDVRRVGERLQARGVACVPRYIQKPAFECRVMADEFPAGTFPRERFPGTYRMLARALVLPWNEAYTEEHVGFIAAEIRRALGGR
jgi:perosamine synthetase